MRNFAGLLLIALAVIAHPASADELKPEQMAAARKLYVSKCAKCHRFYDPTNYSEAEWRSWMAKMNKKSRLKGEQADLLTSYLEAYRAGRLAGKPEGK